VLGLDGAYVRSRHRRPEKNFEVIVGKVLGDGGTAIRFAFPTNHPGSEALCREALYEWNFHSEARMMPLMGGIRPFCCPLLMEFGAVNDQTCPASNGLWPPDRTVFVLKKDT